MNKYFKYRFKTINELEIQYGTDWRGVVGFSISGEMDFLCGTIYVVDISEKTYNNFAKSDRWFDGSYCDWYINAKMLKLRTFEPNYKPKKFSREI